MNTTVSTVWKNGTITVPCYRTHDGNLVSTEKFEKIHTAFTALNLVYGDDFTKEEMKKVQKAITLIMSILPDLDRNDYPY